MLNELQPDVRKLLDLARKMENFDTTLSAVRSAGKPIEPTHAALDERKRMVRHQPIAACFDTPQSGTNQHYPSVG